MAGKSKQQLEAEVAELRAMVASQIADEPEEVDAGSETAQGLPFESNWRVLQAFEGLPIVRACDSAPGQVCIVVDARFITGKSAGDETVWNGTVRTVVNSQIATVGTPKPAPLGLGNARQTMSLRFYEAPDAAAPAATRRQTLKRASS